MEQSKIDILGIDITGFEYVQQAKTKYNKSLRFKSNINYGLLSLISYADGFGFICKMLNGISEADFAIVSKTIKKYSPRIIALSCTSYGSWGVTVEFARKIKSNFPELILIVGGYYLSTLTNFEFLEKYPFDYLFVGESEIAIVEFFKYLNNENSLNDVPNIVYIRGQRVVQNPRLKKRMEKLGMLNYNLVINNEKVVPATEISRGCPYKCNFCSDGNVKGIKFKELSFIQQEMTSILSSFPMRPLPMVLACSTMGPNDIWANHLFDMLLEYKDKISIMIFLSINDTWEKYIDKILKFEIIGLFWGLESCSKTMLKRMNKTSDPDAYLERVLRLCKILKKNKIPNWTNVIIGYPGETSETLKECSDFLFENQQLFDILHFSPYMLYPGSYDFQNFGQLFKLYGCTTKDNTWSQETEVCTVNPSEHFSFEEVEIVAKIYQKMFNTKESFITSLQWFVDEVDSNKKRAKISNFISKTPKSLLPF